MKKENARRVARLLVNKLPKDRESLTKMLDFLTFLSDLYKREREVKDFMLNPLVDTQRKIDYIKSLAERFGPPEESHPALRHLVELGLMPSIGEIRRMFEHEMEKILRLSKGFLIVARPIDKETVERIRQRVSQALGRDISLEVQEDPSIIGGFVVRTPGFVLDASVKRALERLG